MDESVSKQQLKENEARGNVWQWELTKVFFEVMGEGKPFTSDDIWRATESLRIPPVYIARHIGPFFKSFRSSGHLKKLKTYRLSTRNGHSALPEYVSAKHLPKELEQLGDTQ